MRYVYNGSGVDFIFLFHEQKTGYDLSSYHTADAARVVTHPPKILSSLCSLGQKYKNTSLKPTA